MAWTAPRTWVAGEYPTAAQFNAHLRDNLLAAFPVSVDAWTDFTPTLTQSATVTKTMTYARYMKIGRLVIAQVNLSVTGTGTAGNNIVIGLPVAAAVNAGRPWGTGEVFDTSTGANYTGNAISLSTTTVGIRAADTSSNLLGVTSFTAALASGDGVGYSVMYEAAS